MGLKAICVSGLAAAAMLHSSSVQAQVPPPYWSLPAAKPTATSAPLSTAAIDAMIDIPAGRYPLGRVGGSPDQGPLHEIALAAFRIDATEVTNGQYAEFLNALQLPLTGSFDISDISDRNAGAEVLALLGDFAPESSYPIIELDDNEARIILVDGRFQPASGFADHPVTETTWAGARAYCVWRGAELPTEAQWEATARGASNRIYPWGDKPPTPTLVSASGRTGATDPVGSHPSGASPFGALDMAGSLAEWTLSLHRPYPYRAQDGREDVTIEGVRATRGGDYVYDNSATNLTVSFRDGFSKAPQDGHRHIGFRCAL